MREYGKGVVGKPFPMELFRKSLDIRVELAEASMAIDKTRILNSISGQTDLDRAPPASHPKFNEVTAAECSFSS